MSTMRVWPSGHLIDPLNPDLSLICIDDVAHHLAGIFRYGGASRLTVAQHCCEMAHYALRPILAEQMGVISASRSFPYECLMHDSAEYLLGDMIRPLKHHPVFGAVYREAEERVLTILRARFGFGDPDLADAVDGLDKRMCSTEQRDLFELCQPGSIVSISVRIWTPEYAEREFLHLFNLLTPVTPVEEAQVAA